THVFSGSSLNEFRFAVNRTRPTQKSFPIVDIDPALSFVPGKVFGTIQFSSTTSEKLALSTLGTNRAAPQIFAQNLFQESDTFSTVRGIHSLKFGVDVERVQVNSFLGSSSTGNYQFGGLTDLLSARSSRFSVQISDATSTPARGWRRTLYAWFVQDDI